LYFVFSIFLEGILKNILYKILNTRYKIQKSMPFFTSDSIRKNLSGKILGGNVKKSLAAVGAEKKSASFLAAKLSGKDDARRKAIYSRLGVSSTGRRNIEKIISQGEKHFTKSEMEKIMKADELKRRVNASLSRRSSEEGQTGYESGTTQFAGGAVRSRSRVGALRQRPESGLPETPFSRKKSLGIASGPPAQAVSGFAKKENQAEKGFAGQAGAKDNKMKHFNPPNRPIGLGSL
jgi:hypothetical protein